MNSRQARIDFDRNYCEHYSPQGEPTDYCALGCGSTERMQAARAAGEPKMSPCIGGHTTPNVLTFCPKWERRSLERAERRADEIEKAIKRMAIVMPVVNAWRSWSRSNRVGKQEVIACPVCNGRLHLSQAAINGHVRVTCETDGCIAWME